MTTSARAAVLEAQDGPFEFRDIVTGTGWNKIFVGTGN